MLSLSALFVASDIHLHIRLDTYKAACWRSSESYYAPALWGHFGIARSVRLSVPWRSCLGCRHAGCLQISHRRLPKICGLRTRPRTDVDPPRFFLRPSNCHRRRGISSRRLRGDTLFRRCWHVTAGPMVVGLTGEQFQLRREMCAKNNTRWLLAKTNFK